ncbi:hypothetical protein PSAC2689_290013 [Paraburkholderia sacchari]
MSATWRVTDGGRIAQPNVSFPHERTHTCDPLQSIDAVSFQRQLSSAKEPSVVNPGSARCFVKVVGAVRVRKR